MINKDKIKKFLDFLDDCSITDHEKKCIRLLIEFLEKKHISKLTSRSLILYGAPGIGKTYLCKKLLEALELPVLSIGYGNIKLNNAVKCETLEELVKKAEKLEDCIIFMDDIHHVANIEDYEVDSKDMKKIMRLVEHAKTNPNSLFIATINGLWELSSPIIDRIELKIKMFEPCEKHKKTYLRKEYSGYMEKSINNFIAKNSIGYNYRDIDALVRMAYVEGNGSLSRKSIKKAFEIYIPSALSGMNMLRNIKTKFRDVIGRNEMKTFLKRAIRLTKKSYTCKKYGLKRPNLVIFAGPPGTGKSFMGKALAGEAKRPFIKVEPDEIISGRGMSMISRFMRRYQNCIIFIDEADKLLGRSRLSIDDTPSMAMIQDALEGVDGGTNGIVILAMNELGMFGKGFKSRFNIFEFELPDLQEREEFIKRKIEKSSKHLSFGNMNINTVAELTNGMSFRDIEKVWNSMVYWYIDNKKAITTDVLQASVMENRKIACQGNLSYIG